MCTRAARVTLDTSHTPSAVIRSAGNSGWYSQVNPTSLAASNSACCVVPGRMPVTWGRGEQHAPLSDHDRRARALEHPALGADEDDVVLALTGSEPQRRHVGGIGQRLRAEQLPRCVLRQVHRVAAGQGHHGDAVAAGLIHPVRHGCDRHVRGGRSGALTSPRQHQAQHTLPLGAPLLHRSLDGRGPGGEVRRRQLEHLRGADEPGHGAGSYRSPPRRARAGSRRPRRRAAPRRRRRTTTEPRGPALFRPGSPARDRPCATG